MPNGVFYLKTRVIGILQRQNSTHYVVIPPKIRHKSIVIPKKNHLSKQQRLLPFTALANAGAANPQLALLQLPKMITLTDD